MQGLKRLNEVVTSWELVLLACVSYILVDMPFEAAFNHKPQAIEIAADTCIGLVFLGYFLAQGQSSRLIKSIHGWRLARIMMIIPFGSVMDLFFGMNAGWLIYLQIFKVMILPDLVLNIYERNKTNLMPKWFKFVAASTVTFIVINTLACGWLVIYPPTEDSLTEYNKAMYWLITTIATVGYGDITPTTNLGRFYTMGVMIMGATIWGILIASASRMMLASDLRKQQKKEKMDALQSFMRHYDVPSDMQREVYGFFNHQWARKVSEDEQAILSDLPPALQQELQVILNLKPIGRLSLFAGTSKDCLQDVSAALTQVYFSPGQQIISKGEIGEDMYLIGHGSVNVHVADQFITSLGPGACFGEMALIADPKRTTDVTAAGYCDVFKLNKKQLDELILKHADLKENVHRLAAERQEKLKQSKSKEKTGQQAS